MELVSVHGELVREIRNQLGYLVDSPIMRELGDIFDSLISSFEGLGVCHFLEFGDTLRFRENLARAGLARRYYLRCSRLQQNLEDRHLALSRTRAVLDAVAAGALTVGRDIAALSPTDWKGDWEYEEDYCFYKVIHLILLCPDLFPTAEARKLLFSFACSLEGGESLRYEVAASFVARDSERCRDALLALLAAEERQISAGGAWSSGLEEDFIPWLKSRVSVEGLALLNVAELLGMRVNIEHPLCPSPTRYAWTKETFRDLFDEIERLA